MLSIVPHKRGNMADGPECGNDKSRINRRRTHGNAHFDPVVNSTEIKGDRTPCGRAGSAYFRRINVVPAEKVINAPHAAYYLHLRNTKAERFANLTIVAVVGRDSCKFYAISHVKHKDNIPIVCERPARAGHVLG